MSNINRVMAKELAKVDGGKIIRGNVVGNINPLVLWTKWLSYVPKREVVRKKELFTKVARELSIDELEELKTYRIRGRMARLFRKYSNGKCSEEEKMKVYDYMGGSIEELMLDKLSLKDLEIAKKEIIRLSQLPEEELKIKVKEEQKLENYQKLSMIDSYVLYVISNINCARSMDKLDMEIEAQLQRGRVRSRI